MADTGPASSSPSLIIKPVCVCSWVEFICLTSFVLWLECSIKCLLEYKCCLCCGQWFLPLTRSHSWFSIYNYHCGCQKSVALMAPVWLPRVFFFTGAEWKTSIKTRRGRISPCTCQHLSIMGCVMKCRRSSTTLQCTFPPNFLHFSILHLLLIFWHSSVTNMRAE